MGTTYFALWRWVFVLALTLELPIVALAVPRPQRLRAVLVSVLGNAITHPALWFLWPRVLPYSAALVVGELVAVGVEGVLLATVGKLGRRGVWIALFANLYSWAIGELILRGLGPALMRVWYGR